jgi:hypothetical protein
MSEALIGQGLKEEALEVLNEIKSKKSGYRNVTAKIKQVENMDVSELKKKAGKTGAEKDAADDSEGSDDEGEDDNKNKISYI